MIQPFQLAQNGAENLNWYETKMCKERKGKNENNQQKWKCFNINVTQSVENENLNN